MKREPKKSSNSKFEPQSRSTHQMGELLLRERLVSLESLDEARAEIAKHGGTLSGALTKLGYMDELTFVQVLSKSFGVPSVDLDKLQIPNEVIEKISNQFARKFNLVPINIEGNVITIATNDPGTLIHVMDDIKFSKGFSKVEMVIASESQISKALGEFYKEDTINDILVGADMSDEEIRILVEDKIDIESLEKDSEDGQIVRFVNLVLVDAIRKGASDIHIEAFEHSFRIRYRIDGVMSEQMQPPREHRAAIVSRIKVMSQLDISERRLPQDGKIKLLLGSNKDVDFRVSVLPTISGEHVVLRILDKSSLQLDMRKLGFSDFQLRQFKDAVSQPWGMVLVTGPTGSGKTTTLYSALMELNKTTDKILTAEDPVEINVDGIAQVHINEAIGLTFASTLRSFLRQDPDIIMVGEIRDFETAEIAIKAALTGHLVLSTLHTNDAPSTINRFLNMGIEPFLVASAINLIVAQRLVRKICSACKEPLNISIDRIQELGLGDQELTHVQLYHGVGCKRCNNTGYKGRIALYELMPIGDEIKEAVLQGFSAMEIRREAIRLGMVGLRESGIEKMLAGETTLEEVLRVTRK